MGPVGMRRGPCAFPQEISKIAAENCYYPPWVFNFGYMHKSQSIQRNCEKAIFQVDSIIKYHKLLLKLSQFSSLLAHKHKTLHKVSEFPFLLEDIHQRVNSKWSFHKSHWIFCKVCTNFRPHFRLFFGI